MTAVFIAGLMGLAACGGADSDHTNDAPRADSSAPEIMKALATTGAGWLKVADEWATFSVSSTQTVRFGANGAWVQRTVSSGSAPCTNNFFGADPLVGVIKRCEVMQTPAAPIPAPPAPGPAVSLKWVNPIANSTVGARVTLTLAGQGLKNVELFNSGTKVAVASVNSGTAATATIDTTKFANGPLTLTAHAWNSPAGTATFTGEADAGPLTIFVNNTVAPAPRAPLIGTNIHSGGGSAAANQKIADVMAERNLKTARMDYFQASEVAGFRDQVTRLAAKGIKVEASLQGSYQWDQSCNQNLTAVQATAYAQTVAMVQTIGDVVQDFELLNEVSLRPEAKAQVAPWAGAPASAYAGKSCFATMAAALRGMSTAIVDQRKASGRPYRIILGAVGRDFGLLEFMQQQGVAFDVVGYHIYPTLNQLPPGEDPYYGAGGALGQLARFNKPVRINEFNCGEIYNGGYENTVGMSVTNACLASIQKHLSSLLAQKVVNLESISVYELTDRPSQPVPESRFGLMFDINKPKLHLALYAAFAGGLVTASEKQQLSALGLKSQ